MLDILIDWYELNCCVTIERAPDGKYLIHTTEDNIVVTLPELIQNIFTLYRAIELTGRRGQCFN